MELLTIAKRAKVQYETDSESDIVEPPNNDNHNQNGKSDGGIPLSNRIEIDIPGIEFPFSLFFFVESYFVVLCCIFFLYITIEFSH